VVPVLTAAIDVRLGSTSDLRRCPLHVRFALHSDHNADIALGRFGPKTDIVMRFILVGAGELVLGAAFSPRL
jgi:hypothetical protein